MSAPFPPKVLEDLAAFGAALEKAGQHLQRAVGAMAEAQQASKPPQPDRVPPGRSVPVEEQCVRALWGRLGPANRQFLYQLAVEYEPGDAFTIEDAANATGEGKGSVRARLMNLGRSVKSLGGLAPDLWDVSWDESARVNYYEWLPADHRAVLRVVEG